jgi:hypothetical protein
MDAAWALGRFNDTRVIEPLTQTLKNDSDKEVQRIAAESLQVLGYPQPGYEHAYPGSIIEPMRPPSEIGIWGLGYQFIMAYPVTRDLLLEKNQSGIIEENLPPLITSSRLPILLYMGAEVSSPA